MIKYLRTVDDFLFDKVFERLCHWSQQNIGKTHEFWKKICNAIFLILIVLDINHKIYNGISYIGEMIFFALLALFFLCFEKLDNRPENTMNPLRVTEFYFRIFALFFFLYDIFTCFIILDFTSVMDMMIITVLVFILYFAACTDLPKSKTRNRISELFLKEVRVE